jgi:predicted NAD/FAD-dependent oxidoreductase
LSRADAKVTLFERARGLGGRLATTRQGDMAFDHGAQFITARSRPFLRYAEVAARAGALAAWQPRIMEDDRTWEAPIGDWWVGTPGMSALVRPLTRNIEIRSGVTVQEMHSGQRGWQLLTDAGARTMMFDASR